MGLSIQETNDALKASIMFSKIAGISGSEATQLLISSMRGYKLEVSDLISIVDKLSAVDMASASSSQDLAIALSKTANSAQLAGVSFDKMLGYIATVKEVTQGAAENIGNAFKTIFSRLQNVKLGSFIDPETGDDISDVETVLKEFDIKLRDTNGNFRNMEIVLDEVAGRWKTFTNLQQSAIATTIAGKQCLMLEHIVIYDLVV